MNYNYANFTNPQQYNNYARNILPKVINSNIQNQTPQKRVVSKTNNNNFAPKSAKRNSRNNKKNVKFDENVKVIKVVSYKEYNKLDDNNLINGKINNYNSDYVNTGPNNNDRKTKNCECNIF